MSRWQQANPDATMTEIEEAVEAELAKLRKQLVEEMVREKKLPAKRCQTVPNVVRKWSRMGGESGS
jgi:hypothetical protein